MKKVNIACKLWKWTNSRINSLEYYMIAIHHENTNSLEARDGFIQPIFYKRFDHFSLQIRQNASKKQWSAVTSLGE